MLPDNGLEFVVSATLQGNLRFTTKVKCEELEVSLVGDPAVVVQIDFREQYCQFLSGWHHIDICQAIRQSQNKFLEAHETLVSTHKAMNSVQSHECEFSVVKLQEEVCHLIVTDQSIAVLIVAEGISENIEDIELIRLHQLLQDLDDLIVFEVAVLVDVELLDQFQGTFPCSPCEIQTRELEWIKVPLLFNESQLFIRQDEISANGKVSVVFLDVVL